MLIQDPVIEPFVIKAEDDSFAVGKMNHSEKTGDTFYPMWFYSGFDHAVKKIVKIKTNEGDDIVTISEYLQKFTEVKEEITNALSLY